MITLAAYGIRKAYKKQQARKAHKDQLEKENGDPTSLSQFDDLRSTSSYRQSSHQHRHPVNGAPFDYTSSTPSSLTRVESSYSASAYSQKSIKDPMEEMRQYQAYVQRQSYDFGTETDPPTYECVVGEDTDAARSPWKSPFNMPAKTESISEIRESRHVPRGLDRLVELDSSSESSPTRSQKVPLRLFHPQNLVAIGDQTTKLPAEHPEHPEQIVPPILDDQLQASLDELFVEASPPRNVRKSREVERFELPADEAQEQRPEVERPQLKRPRSESGSEIESEDNEEVIVRFNVADRTKRPFPKRVTGTSI